MHKVFYGFEENGFKKISDRRLRYRHESYANAFETLLTAIRRDKGFAVLTGAPGTGKTKLVDDLAARVRSEGCMVGKVTNCRVDADDMARLVGFTFGLQADAFSKARLLTEIEERLVDGNSSGQPVILLIDEVQDLSIEALQELHLLFDLVSRRGRVIQILLAGQEQLWERLRQPECEQIRQLVVESCRLLPLAPNETRAYVDHLLRHVGWSGDPEISNDALRLIHERTGGVPRLINLTTGRLLLHGSLCELHLLGPDDVETVLEQMGEDHPELLRDASEQRQPLHPRSSQSLLPLDVGAAEESESPKPRFQGPDPSPIEAPIRNAAAQSSMDWVTRVTGWSWKWALAGLSATTICSYLIFLISVENGESSPAAAKEPDPSALESSAPEPRGLVAEPNAHMRLPAADVDVVDSGKRFEVTEHLASELAKDSSASVGSVATSDQQSLAETRTTDASAAITGPVPSDVAQAESPDRQGGADDEISELLAKAESALAENRLTVPSSDNAYGYYQAVLARDPENAQARAGVRRIVQRYRQLARQRLNKGDLRGARLFASRGLKVWPRDRQLSAIKRKTAKPRRARQENRLPEILERVEKWFRSGNTRTSPFLDQ